MAAAAVSDALDLDDIQALVVRAHAKLPAASFLLLTITDAAAARGWVSDHAATVATGTRRSTESAVQVALTSSGLRALGLSDQVVTQFADEFVEGIDTAFRRRLLGDTAESAPESWTWGGPAAAPVHVAVLLYAAGAGALADLDAAESADAAAHGLRLAARLDTVDLAGNEQFGFHDGVSQPLVDGLSKAAGVSGAIAAGEFILGYPNAYGLLGERPVLPGSDGGAAGLPRDAGGSGGGDLGRNGTYLVLRQLRQDVRGFWRFADAAAGGHAQERTRIASRMMGRWPSGAPLVLSPDRDDPALADENGFTYHAADPLGMRCPIGSHVRRANPRDALDPKPGTPSSVEVNDHHRILRRGREYGPPVDPATLLDGAGDPTDRGLHFLCLNASIRRQFEFVQHTWLNSPHFAGLYNDDDPVVGARDPGGGMFTIPEEPVRRRLTGLPRFVTVRGGAYLFLPGIRALRYLGSLDGGAP